MTEIPFQVNGVNELHISHPARSHSKKKKLLVFLPTRKKKITPDKKQLVKKIRALGEIHTIYAHLQ
jgi:hypothetical protein